MARTSVLTNPTRANLNFETELLAAGQNKAKGLNLSFSEYCSRLLVADLNRKGSAAEKASRHVRKPRLAA